MVSREVWIKQALMSFQTSNITRPSYSYFFDGMLFEKLTRSCVFHPNCAHRNHRITYTKIAVI